MSSVLNPNPYVTTRDIAQKVGCSHTTVSRALRGNGVVKHETRQRILKAAKELGYRPNPMVASLLATRNRRGVRQHLTANIAWMNSHPRSDFWDLTTYNANRRDSARARAAELGYGFEEIWTFEPSMTGKRLAKILKARGVVGLIVPDCVIQLEQIGFDWSPYPVVSLGAWRQGHLDWHQVDSSGLQNVALAFSSLRRLGYRKIGFFSNTYIPDQDRERCQELDRFNLGKSRNHSFFNDDYIRGCFASYAYCQTLIAKSERVLAHCLNQNTDSFLDDLADWIRQEKMDALICDHSDTLKAAQMAGREVPQDLALAHLKVDSDVQDWAGVDIKRGHQAAIAVNMLHSQIINNERGIPPYRQVVSVQGEWRDGWTAPPKS